MQLEKLFTKFLWETQLLIRKYIGVIGNLFVIEKGGLGIRDFEDIIQACEALVALLVSKFSMGVIMKVKYCSTSHPEMVPFKYLASPV